MTSSELLRELADTFSPANLKRNRHRLLAMWTMYPLLAAMLGSWVQAGAIALVCTFLADALLRRYLGSLETRKAADNGPAWDVEVNQVKVGTIADSDYAAIRLRVFDDARTYYAQALNILRVAFSALDYCYRAMPLAAFWAAVALFFLAPDTFSETVSAVQRATADELKHAVGFAGTLLSFSMILAVSVHWALGISRFGFIDRFDEAIGTAVRQHCSVAADGSVVLSRLTTEGPVFNDEGAFLRRGA